MPTKDISFSRLTEMCGALVELNSGLIPCALPDHIAYEAFRGAFNATEETTKKRIFFLWNEGFSPNQIWDVLDNDMKRIV